jgi:4-amino-4-deoxy-L-arabinose transferase-like glycosyltransferase
MERKSVSPSAKSVNRKAVAGAANAASSLDLSAALPLFLTALLVRVLYAWLRDVGTPVPPGTDAVSYDAFARAILAGPAWILHPGPELFRPPVYPMILAAQYALFGGNMTLVQLSQALIGAASVVLVYEFGRRHVGRGPALWAAAWLLLNPLHLDFTGKLLRENWLVLLQVAFVASLLARDGFRAGGLARSALLLTLLIHMDSRYLVHLPFVPAFLLLALDDGSKWPITPGRIGRTVGPATVLLGLVLLFSAPWALRNAFAYDHPVVVDPRVLGRWGGRAATTVAGDVETAETMMAEFEARKMARFDSLKAEERAAFTAGVRPRYGQPHKAIFNFTEFWRIAHFGREYRPFPDTRFAGSWSLEHNLASLVFMGLLLPAFLLGLWRGLVAVDRAVLVMASVIVVHTLLHVVVHSVTRYRLPVEPLYALIAFGEMARWPWPRWRRAPRETV